MLCHLPTCTSQHHSDALLKGAALFVLMRPSPAHPAAEAGQCWRLLCCYLRTTCSSRGVWELRLCSSRERLRKPTPSVSNPLGNAHYSEKLARHEARRETRRTGTRILAGGEQTHSEEPAHSRLCEWERRIRPGSSSAVDDLGVFTLEPAGQALEETVSLS